MIRVAAAVLALVLTADVSEARLGDIQVGEGLCPPGKVWLECGSGCPKNCDDVGEVFCMAMCRPGCFCPPEKPYTNSNGDCVASCFANVKPDTNQCSGGKVWTSCAGCPKKCGEVEGTFCMTMCQEGCACPPEKPFTSSSGECVASCPTSEVDQFPIADFGMCPNGQIFQECKPCPQVCGEQEVVCTTVCESGCGCPPEKPFWDKNSNECVKNCEAVDLRPADDVLAACEGGKVRKECASSCPKICGEPEPDFCIKMCVVNGCECPDDKPWFDKSAGKCVPMCGALGPDQVSSKDACPLRTTANPAACLHVCGKPADECQPGCECTDPRRPFYNAQLKRCVPRCIQGVGALLQQ